MFIENISIVGTQTNYTIKMHIYEWYTNRSCLSHRPCLMHIFLHKLYHFHSLRIHGSNIPHGLLRHFSVVYTEQAHRGHNFYGKQSSKI